MENIAPPTSPGMPGDPRPADGQVGLTNAEAVGERVSIAYARAVTGHNLG